MAGFFDVLWEMLFSGPTADRLRRIRHHTDYVVPQQLFQLVRQAHTGKREEMPWDIRMSEEMQTALRAPLTPQQIEMLSQMRDENISTFVSGYVLSYKHKDTELSGIVCVNIDIFSRSGQYNYKFSGVKLRVTVRQVGKPLEGNWAVSSAEMIEDGEKSAARK